MSDYIRAKFVPIFVIFLLVVSIGVIIAVRHNLQRDLSDMPKPRLAAPPITGANTGEAKQNQLGKFVPTNPPRPMPNMIYKSEADKDIQMRGLLGQLRIFNFWATWCVPCVAEMPALQRLSERKAADGVSVIGISLDRGGFATIAPFMQKHKLDKFSVLSDASSKSLAEFSLKGFPTTLFYNNRGEEIGRIEGEYDWDSAASDQLIAELLAQSK